MISCETGVVTLEVSNKAIESPKAVKHLKLWEFGVSSNELEFLVNITYAFGEKQISVGLL